MPGGEFQPLIDVDQQIAKVTDALAAIRTPLDAVYGLVKPIEPPPDAVGAVTAVTVDPVIDHVLGAVGIDRIVDEAKARILGGDGFPGILPEIEVLDRFEGVFDRAKAAILDDFGPSAPDDPLTIEAWIDTGLREQEAGAKTADVCRRQGISRATFYVYGWPSLCKRSEDTTDRSGC